MPRLPNVVSQDCANAVSSGAWPLPLPDYYAIDAAHMSEYAQLAATAEGFADYLQRYVYERRAA